MATQNEKTDTSLMVHEPAVAVNFQPETMEEMMRVAKVIAMSSIIPKAYYNKPADIVVCALTGRELGLDFMQSLRGMYVIDGKAVMHATCIVGICKTSPHCKYFTLIKSTNDIATYETWRVGDPKPTQLSYTIKQAGDAGYLRKNNWRCHPAAMLRARASAALARTVYEDTIHGIYNLNEGEEIGGKKLDPPVPMMEAEAKAEEAIVEAAGRPPKRKKVYNVSGLVAEVVDSTIEAEFEIVPDEKDPTDHPTMWGMCELYKNLEGQMRDLRDTVDFDALRSLSDEIREHHEAQRIADEHRDDLASLYLEIRDSIRATYAKDVESA